MKNKFKNSEKCVSLLYGEKVINRLYLTFPHLLWSSFNCDVASFKIGSNYQRSKSKLGSNVKGVSYE